MSRLYKRPYKDIINSSLPSFFSLVNNQTRNSCVNWFWNTFTIPLQLFFFKYEKFCSKGFRQLRNCHLYSTATRKRSHKVKFCSPSAFVVETYLIFNLRSALSTIDCFKTFYSSFHSALSYLRYGSIHVSDIVESHRSNANELNLFRLPIFPRFLQRHTANEPAILRVPFHKLVQTYFSSTLSFSIYP